MKECELAERYARRVAVSKGIGYRWRELLGASWVGVRRSLKAGRVRDCELYRSVLLTLIDVYRAETGYRKRKRNRIKVNQLRDQELIEDRGEVPPYEEQLLILWTDSKPLRRWATPIENLMLYLYTVEGLTLEEVGNVWGLSRARISILVKEYRKGVEFARYCNGTGVAPAPLSPALIEVRS